MCAGLYTPGSKVQSFLTLNRLLQTYHCT